MAEMFERFQSIVKLHCRRFLATENYSRMGQLLREPDKGIIVAVLWSLWRIETLAS